MKKKEANDARVSEVLSDWLDEDNEDAFSDEPDMGVMIEFLRLKTDTALELTKMILQHCKMDNLTAKDVYRIFSESVQMSETLDIEHTAKS